eukprot:8352039-Pyramimonas_sp.AAC.1
MIWSAVAWGPCCRGHWRMRLRTVLTTVTSRAPGGASTIQPQDLIPPVEGGSSDCAVLLFLGARAAARNDQTQGEGIDLTC